MKPWLRKEINEFVELYGAKIHYKKLGYGDQRKLGEKAIVYDKKGQPLRVDQTLAMTLQIVHSITDWELTDENGNKLPITMDTFDNLLDADFVAEIIQTIHPKINAGVTEEEKKQ